MEVKGEQSSEIFQLETNQFPLQSIKQIALLTKLPLNRAIANQIHQGKVSAKISVDLDSIGKETLPLFQAEAEIIDGEMQELLAALQIFEFRDLSRGLTPPTYNDSQDLYLEPDQLTPTREELAASDRPEELAPDFHRLSDQVAEVSPREAEPESSDPSLVAVGFPQESRKSPSIQSQLRRFFAIRNLHQQQQRQRKRASPFPDLIDLQGSLNTKLVVSNTVENQLKAEFQFQGGSEEEPWQWGPYAAHLVTLQGKFEDGSFTLSPAKIQTTDGMSVQLSGSLKDNTLWGTVLKIEQLPIKIVRDLLELPAAIGSDGTIDLQANLSGLINNPSLLGSIVVKDGRIEQTKIPQIKGSFTYNNSRFSLFAGSRFGEGTGKTDQVTLTASIPYQLPISTVKPDSNELNLTISVIDEGMRLLNIGTREQIRWLNGTAAVDLRITAQLNEEAGKIRLRQPIADGEVILENATIQIQALPEEPLTQVNGNISFNLDSIQVEKLDGEFSGGKVAVKGDLPLAKPIPQDNPLTVIIDQLAFNLKSLYKGGVSGNLLVAGTALEPKIKGEVDLFNGTVFLAEQTAAPPNIEQQKNLFEFQNLALKLGNNIKISKPPLLDFLATGDLSLYGTLQDPRLNGKVRLQRGQVNLFTTQFQLTGGEEHTAQFFFSDGLDPLLDVSLRASVTEKTRKGIPRDPLSAEVSISDNPALDIGGLQTVRIQATVFGPASKLTNNLQLTSSPPRGETEIVNLLGGGLIEAITGVDSTLGLANFAGSALLGTFQNTIGNALGLSEFRLFPALITDDENRSSTLGLGAEVSVDLGKKLSFSALKIINSPQPVQYGILYHLNDFILLRGSTDLFGDDRGAIEYELKF